MHFSKVVLILGLSLTVFAQGHHTSSAVASPAANGAGGKAAGGNAAGGSATGGNAAGGSPARGKTAGGNTAGGNAAGTATGGKKSTGSTATAAANGAGAGNAAGTAAGGTKQSTKQSAATTSATAVNKACVVGAGTRANFIVLADRSVHTHEKANGGNGTANKGNGTQHDGANNVKEKCVEINRLTELTNLVDNSTKLADFQTKHNLTAAEMTKLKSEAANATATLKQLSSNTTLVSQCATINAAEKLKTTCKEMQGLSDVIALVNNATALQALQTKYNLTNAEVAKIKQGAANATAKLTMLKSNSTLVAACQKLESGMNGTMTGAASGTGTTLKSSVAATATGSGTASAAIAKASNNGAVRMVGLYGNWGFVVISVGMAVMLAA